MTAFRRQSISPYLESQSKVQTKSDRRRRRAAGGTIETNGQHGLSKVGLEKAVLDRPAVIYQRRESPLRRIHIERCSNPNAEVVSHAPHESRMYREVGQPRSPLHTRYKFEVVC